MLFLSVIITWTAVAAPFISSVNAISLPPSSMLHSVARKEPRLTNAERFRRGLPPNRPRQIYDPTHASRALSPRTSNTVTTLYWAEIAYVDNPSEVAGYLAFTSESSGRLAWVVRLVAPSAPSPFSASRRAS